MGGQATNELLGIEGKIERGLGFTGKLKLCIYHIYIYTGKMHGDYMQCKCFSFM